MSRFFPRTPSRSPRAKSINYGQYSSAALAQAIDSTLKPKNLTMQHASKQFSIPEATLQRYRKPIIEKLAFSLFIERKSRITQLVMEEFN